MRRFCLLGVALGMASLALPAPSADEVKQAARPDTDALAKKLVTQCARLKDGDIVQISGGVHDVELLESLAVESAKLGADHLLTLTPSDRTMRRLYTEVPAKYDARTPTGGLKLAEMVTAVISVDSTESDAALADVPPARISARMESGLKVYETLLKRNVRQVSLGNGLYPSEDRAKRLGLTRAELAKLYYGGLDVDYDKLQATGEAARKALAGGKKARITTPEGTDLAVEIAGRPCFVSDGVLSDEKLRKGGAACQTWLPAGEVYLSPVPGTAEGKVVVERMLFEGKEVLGLSLTFKKGKMTEMTAKSGLERLRGLYEAAGGGRDEFSAIDVGINPAVRLPKASPTGLYMEAGTITVNAGNNVWAGGDNKASFALTCFLRGGTLRVDDKALVEDGALQAAR
jgi:leucyl aminopeptidase (aminopeptidase T)